MGVQKLIQYYSTTITFSRQLEYRQHLLFLPSLEVFLLFFRSKIPCNKGQTKNSCTSPFMSLNISGYPIFYLQALISQKSLKYKVGLQVRLSKVYTYIVKLRKPSNDCLPSEPMIMRVSPQCKGFKGKKIQNGGHVQRHKKIDFKAQASSSLSDCTWLELRILFSNNKVISLCTSLTIESLHLFFSSHTFLSFFLSPEFSFSFPNLFIGHFL